MLEHPNRMEKKLKELQKRYPDNVYKIEERTIRKQLITSIVRVHGRRPHKVSDKRR